jgi:hypothetical protein
LIDTKIPRIGYDTGDFLRLKKVFRNMRFVGMHKYFRIFALEGGLFRLKSGWLLYNMLLLADSDRKCDKNPVRLLSHLLCYTGVTEGENNKSPSQNENFDEADDRK